LYELARKGETVERQPRAIRIDEIRLLECAGTRLVFRVACSKGTYIRTLVEDIAREAGTVAHTSRLHRESVGSFESAGMLDLAAVEARAAQDLDALRASLLPADEALTDLPSATVSDPDGMRFCGGQPIAVDVGNEQGLVRVYSAGQGFLGVGELTGDGQLAPRRVFLTQEKTP